MTADPFATLGLPASPDLTDDDVRTAWRRIAAQTHPDRGDGGDPVRFAAAAAAYTELRTRYGRGEAYADLTAPRRRHSPERARRSPGRGTTTPPPGPRPAGPTGHADHGPAAAADRAPVGPADRGQAAAAGRGPARRYGPMALLASRVRRGRPALLGLRLAVAAGLSSAAFAVTGAQPAAAGLTAGAVTWFLLTARHDLAPPLPVPGAAGERTRG
ncbi:MAG TPA: J domain-containing protein [Streptosporangiaceae bacterium]